MSEGKKKSVRTLLAEKRKEFKPKLIKDKKVNLLLHHWELKSLRKTKEGTKESQKNTTYIRRLLRGTLFINTLFAQFNKKYTVDDFLLSLKRFHLSCNNPEFVPADKTYIRRVNINKFLFNPFAQQEITKSYFLHFLHREPLRISWESSTDNPLLAKTLFEKYCEEITHNMVHPDKLPPSIRNKLIVAADRLQEFFTENEENLQTANISHARMVDILFKSVFDDIKKGTKLTAGFFCSDLTFQDRLPRYIVKIGVQIQTPKERVNQLGKLL